MRTWKQYKNSTKSISWFYCNNKMYCISIEFGHFYAFSGPKIILQLFFAKKTWKSEVRLDKIIFIADLRIPKYMQEQHYRIRNMILQNKNNEKRTPVFWLCTHSWCRKIQLSIPMLYVIDFIDNRLSNRLR